MKRSWRALMASGAACVALAPANGSAQWRTDLAGGALNLGTAIALDQAGDVFAGGHTSGGGPLNDFTVVKLDGSTGGEALDEPSQGSLEFRLSTGSTQIAQSHCMRFTDPVVDTPAQNGRVGSFRARNAPAPAVCTP